MLKRFFIPSLLFLFIKQGTALADQSKEVELLLKMERRPQYADIIKAFGGEWPKKNPIEKRYSPSRRSVGAILEKLPLVMLALEQSFPGGTYAFLGRDVGTLGDFIQMAYAFHFGQTDRVKYFDASKESFPSYNDFSVNYPYILGHLKRIGFDMDQVDAQKHPWVVVDVASWRDMSQLRQVMRAGYQRYADLGKDPKQLIHKFNVLAVGMHFFREFTESDFEPQAYLAEMAETASSTGIGTDPIFLNVQSDFAYLSTLWHGTFERFELQPDGTATTRPGFTHSRDARLDALDEIFEGAEVIASPEFRARLDATFREAGFEFPTTRTNVLQGTPTRSYVKKERPTYSYSYGGSSFESSSKNSALEYWKVERSELGKAAISQIQSYDRSYNEIIDNSTDIRVQAKKIRALAVNFLEDIAGMAERGSYHRKEFVYFARHILNDYFIAATQDPHFESLYQLIQKHLALRSIWNKDIIVQNQAPWVELQTMKYGYDSLELFIKNAKLPKIQQPEILLIFGAKDQIEQKVKEAKAQPVPQCNKTAIQAIEGILVGFSEGLVPQDILSSSIASFIGEIYSGESKDYLRQLQLLVEQYPAAFQSIQSQLKTASRSTERLLTSELLRGVLKALSNIELQQQCEEDLVE